LVPDTTAQASGCLVACSACHACGSCFVLVLAAGYNDREADKLEESAMNKSASLITLKAKPGQRDEV
jgi:hypothetical protein